METAPHQCSYSVKDGHHGHSPHLVSQGKDPSIDPMNKYNYFINVYL